MSGCGPEEQQALRDQITRLEAEMEEIRGRREEELIGGRHDDHDWEKIANIDFEGTRDAADIQRFWQNFLHPDVNKSSWSQQEISALEKAVRKHGQRDWNSIAQELGGGRTAFMCLQTFQRFVSTEFRRSAWSKDEDDQLKTLVERMKIGSFLPYTQMSYFMTARLPSQLMARWTNVLDPSLRKGFWTPAEDELLLKAVSRHGEKNWWKIRLEVPGRTDSSCRDRYLDCLKGDRKLGPFDQQEKELLIQLVQKHGVGRWARIAVDIPQRSDSQCLREWGKMTRIRKRKVKGTGKAQKKVQKREGISKKQTRRVLHSIRKRLKKIEEEEEEEEDEEGIVYMDSDEEEKKLIKQEHKEERRRETEESRQPEEVHKQEVYVAPPLEAWLPVKRTKRGGTVTTTPVALPCPLPDSTRSSDPCPLSSPAPLPRPAPLPCPTPPGGQQPDGVRSCVVDQFGGQIDTIMGAERSAPPVKNRGSVLSMVKVSASEIKSLMQWKMANSKCGRPRAEQRGPQPFTTNSFSLQFELMAAVSPWIGNMLLPSPLSTTTRHVDEMAQKVKALQLSSTPVFLLFLQVLMVDVAGCKDIIEQRKKGISTQGVAGLVVKDQRQSSRPFVTVADLLAQKRRTKEEAPPPTPPAQPVLPLVQVSWPGALQTTPCPASAAPLLVPSTAPPPSPSLAPPVTLSIAPAPVIFLRPPSAPAIASRPVPAIAPRPVPAIAPPPVPAIAPPPATSIAPPPDISIAPTLVPPTAPPPMLYIIPSTHTQSGPSNQSKPTTTCSSGQEKPTGRKRGRSQKDQGKLTREQSHGQSDEQRDGQSNGGCLSPERKRARKPSLKAKALQEAVESKAAAKGKKATPSSGRTQTTAEKPIGQTVQKVPPSSVLLAPSPPWIMTGSGPVLLVGGCPPQASTSHRANANDSAPPTNVSQLGPPPQTFSAKSILVNANHPGQLKYYQQCLLPQLPSTSQVPLLPSPSTLTKAQPQLDKLHHQLDRPHPQPDRPTPQPERSPTKLDSPHPQHDKPQPLPSAGSSPGSSLLPHPLSAAPPPRTEAVRFDCSLLFCEPRGQVQVWLSGRGGVTVPGLGNALPYMPPFISSLNTLSMLLRAKNSLTASAMQLLPNFKPGPSPATKSGSRGNPKPGSKANSKPGSRPTPDPMSHPAISFTAFPSPDHDYTTCSAAPHRPDPGQETHTAPSEEECVAAVRHLVAERFTKNPAYQLLKARFLSCLTLPALLATIQPTIAESSAPTANEEEYPADKNGKIQSFP